MKLYKIVRNVKSIVLFLFAFTSFGFAQFENEPKAVIKPMAFDFGDIVQDSVVTNYFVIKNEGGDLLKITKVSASCGCTAVIPEKNELKPDESTNIKVSFDSKGRSGKQTKIITVETNDKKNSTIKLTLTGNVIKKESQQESGLMKQNKSIIREGVIDLQLIDENKDGKVFQDMMDWNVISDKPGDCPLCGMTLKLNALNEAKANLVKHGYKVVEK